MADIKCVNQIGPTFTKVRADQQEIAHTRKGCVQSINQSINIVLLANIQIYPCWHSRNRGM